VKRWLILASKSPQRRAILEQLGVSFSIEVPDVEELEVGPPPEVALENAYRKAAAIADLDGNADALILAVDTVVSIGARMWGKPGDADEARETLRALAGRTHAVISGVCLLQDGRQRAAAATTLVEFRALDDALIEWYVRTGEWRERAGGYAIQGHGAALVNRIDGDYTNVVGLPVPTLLELHPRLLAAD
jgi:nucleoside triphosphate pyrophosphatase